MTEESIRSGLDLSVVIVNWHTREYTVECIDALLVAGRPLGGMEIWVIDNENDPCLREVITRRYPSVRLRQNRHNRGFAVASNQGMHGSRGRFVLLVNPDTKVESETLITCVHYLEQHPSVGVVACQLLNADGSIQRSCRSFPTLISVLWDAALLDGIPALQRVTGRYELRTWGHDSEREVDQPAGAFLMLRRDVLVQVGGMDERFFMYYEDVDWCKRVREAGWRIMFVPQAKAHHAAGGAAHGSYNRAVAHMYRSRLAYFEKHHGRAAARAVRVVTFVGIWSHLLLWAARWAVAPSQRPQFRRLIAGNLQLVREVLV